MLGGSSSENADGAVLRAERRGRRSPQTDAARAADALEVGQRRRSRRSRPCRADLRRVRRRSTRRVAWKAITAVDVAALAGSACRAGGATVRRVGPAGEERLALVGGDASAASAAAARARRRAAPRRRSRPSVIAARVGREASVAIGTNRRPQPLTKRSGDGVRTSGPRRPDGRRGPRRTSRRCRRQRERQRLRVRARPQRVVGADRLLELQRHRVVADRRRPGQQRQRRCRDVRERGVRVGRVGRPGLAGACASSDVPLTRWPGLVVLGSTTLSAASPARRDRRWPWCWPRRCSPTPGDEGRRTSRAEPNVRPSVCGDVAR